MFFLNSGFVQSKSNNSLHLKKSVLVLLAYVDGVFLASNDEYVAIKFKSYLEKSTQAKKFGNTSNSFLDPRWHEAIKAYLYVNKNMH